MCTDIAVDILELVCFLLAFFTYFIFKYKSEYPVQQNERLYLTMLKKANELVKIGRQKKPELDRCIKDYSKI